MSITLEQSLEVLGVLFAITLFIGGLAMRQVWNQGDEFDTSGRTFVEMLCVSGDVSRPTGCSGIDTRHPSWSLDEAVGSRSFAHYIAAEVWKIPCVTARITRCSDLRLRQNSQKAKSSAGR